MSETANPIMDKVNKLFGGEAPEVPIPSKDKDENYVHKKAVAVEMLKEKKLNRFLLFCHLIIPALVFALKVFNDMATLVLIGAVWVMVSLMLKGNIQQINYLRSKYELK